MNLKDLIGAKIVDVELFNNEIEHIIVKLDNKYIRIVGTEEYPWIMWYHEKVICPNCNTKMSYKPTIPESGEYGYLCESCGYKE